MHDGSIATLMGVIEFYNRGGDVKRKSKSPLVKKLGLTKKEKMQLFKFLETLTSKDDLGEMPILPMNY